MAGLLDFLNTPEGMGLLSAAAGGMAGARRGTPWNNVGRGLVTGLSGYAGAQDQIRQDSEQAFQKQYRQMQMDKLQQDMAAQKGMRESLQSLYKPAGTVPFQADNPFGEDLGELKTETPATFGGKPVDPVMAAVLPYAQPDDILKMAGGQSKTAEQKNWEYAQGLPEDQRAMFLSKSGGSGPATVQEWEYFSKLDAPSQARFLEMKRNPQIMNLGGAQAVRAPGGGISESYVVTPKITETPEFQAAQETAKVSARETVERGAEATSNLPKVQASAANARNMVQGVLNHPGFSSTVGMTMMPGARFIPGTKEADFQSRMDQLKGSAFLQAFETLKGGGQITEVEGKKATDAINRMSISTSENEFRQAAQDFLSVVDRAEQNAIRSAKATPTQGRAGTLNRGEILNVELQDAIARGDTQNAELIRQEMRRMKVREPAKQPAKQSGGTFKNPIRVTNDADYNNVPKGKYYQAPDGSIRIRK